ncbi:MAG TPA: carboxymuconolactone decarboxylase family protein [Blastocatellia bacterium]
MARLRYLEESELPPRIAALLQGRPLLNIFRTLAHSETAGIGFLALGRALLAESDLDPKLRELVILRVGSLSSGAYEIYQHKRLAKSAGLSEAEIAAALREAPDDNLPEPVRQVLAFVDSVVWEVKAPDPLYRAVAGQLADKQMVELLLTIGFYMLVCRFLENLEVDIESAGPSNAQS